MQAGFKLERDLQWRLPPVKARALPMLSPSRGLTHEGRMCELQHGWCSDAGLQGCNGECLHNLLGRLGLDNGHLAEDFPLAGLGSGLHAGLEAAQAGRVKIPAFFTSAV